MLSITPMTGLNPNRAMPGIDSGVINNYRLYVSISVSFFPPIMLCNAGFLTQPAFLTGLWHKNNNAVGDICTMGCNGENQGFIKTFRQLPFVPNNLGKHGKRIF